MRANNTADLFRSQTDLDANIVTILYAVLSGNYLNSLLWVSCLEDVRNEWHIISYIGGKSNYPINSKHNPRRYHSPLGLKSASSRLQMLHIKGGLDKRSMMVHGMCFKFNHMAARCAQTPRGPWLIWRDWVRGDYPPTCTTCWGGVGLVWQISLLWCCQWADNLPVQRFMCLFKLLVFCIGNLLWHSLGWRKHLLSTKTIHTIPLLITVDTFMISNSCS